MIAFVNTPVQARLLRNPWRKGALARYEVLAERCTCLATILRSCNCEEAIQGHKQTPVSLGGVACNQMSAITKKVWEMRANDFMRELHWWTSKRTDIHRRYSK